MTISEDASNQPVPVHSTTTTAVTASFSPQAGTLLVAMLAVDGAGTGATTAIMSDSLAGAWTLLARSNAHSNPSLGGSSEVWCQYLAAAPGSMTAIGTWTTTGQAAGNLTVRSLLGAAPTQTGAVGTTGGTSVAPTATLTPTQLGSWVYGACLDYATNASLTANTNTTLIDQFQDSTNGDTWATFKGKVATASLSSTAYGFTNANNAFNTAVAEILAATVSASVAPSLVIGQAVGRAASW